MKLMEILSNMSSAEMALVIVCGIVAIGLFGWFLHVYWHAGPFSDIDD